MRRPPPPPGLPRRRLVAVDRFAVNRRIHRINLRHQPVGGFDKPRHLIHRPVEHHENRHRPRPVFRQKSIRQRHIIIPVEHLQVDVRAAVRQPQNHRRSAERIAAPIRGKHRQIDRLPQPPGPLQRIRRNRHPIVDCHKRIPIHLDLRDIFLGSHSRRKLPLAEPHCHTPQSDFPSITGGIIIHTPPPRDKIGGQPQTPAEAPLDDQH